MNGMSHKTTEAFLVTELCKKASLYYLMYPSLEIKYVDFQ